MDNNIFFISFYLYRSWTPESFFFLFQKAKIRNYQNNAKYVFRFFLFFIQMTDSFKFLYSWLLVGCLVVWLSCCLVDWYCLPDSSSILVFTPGTKSRDYMKERDGCLEDSTNQQYNHTTKQQNNQPANYTTLSIFLCKPFFEYLTILIILLGKWHVASTYEEMPFGIRNAVIEGLCH